MTPIEPRLGLLLKRWRALRGKSQLALALDAGVSPRHLSFVEIGRSQPSREMLFALADALDVPLRDRNLLLAAAGFAPAFAESALSEIEMSGLRSALAALLAHQEPYPAVVLDRHWNVVGANRSAPKLFGLFVDAATLPQPLNLLRTMMSPTMRPFLENWDAVSASLTHRIFREAVGGVPEPSILELHHDLSASRERPLDPSGGVHAMPFHPVVFVKGDLRLSFFSMVTTVGAPLDITAQELRIESFFPTDEVTETFARRALAP